MDQPSKILIVEDDPNLLDAAARLLSRNGYAVFKAATGTEALKLVRQVLPDLVLLDVMLPDTNGFLICEQIKLDPLTAEIYVMFLSGTKINTESQSRGLELGAEGYMVRPVSNRELLARIESLFRVKNTEKALRSAHQELARLNEALTRSNEDLQQFAYAVSHDLKEPLRMVTGFLGLLERGYAGQLDDTAKEYIDFAVDGAERMKTMIDGLLTLSRVVSQEGQYELVSGDDVLRKVLQNLRVAIQESGAQIEFSALPDFCADESQILRVFQNLIANAIKYCRESIPKITISADENEAEWVFKIADNGIGIDPKDQERVFQLFQRLQTQDERAGVGIGLAICHRIVQQHGGRIWVESRLGSGSQFYFTIPKDAV